MRVAFVADVHVHNFQEFGGPHVAGVNDRCRIVLGVLRRAIQLAYDQCCQRLVILGDLFDTARPPPQVLTEVQRLFLERPCNLPIIDIVAGNHDVVSPVPGDNALGPLWPLLGVQVHEKPAARFHDGVMLVFAPYQPGPPEQWMEGAVDQALQGTVGTTRDQRVLCTHAGIVTESTEHFLKESGIRAERLVDIMAKHGIQTCLAGDWHRHKVFRKGDFTCMQVGTLAPAGWDDEGTDDFGVMAIYDSEADEGHRLSTWRIPGPRFVTERDAGYHTIEDLEALISYRKQGGSIFLRRICRTPDEKKATEQHLRCLRNDGSIDGFRAELDRDVVQEALRKAAAEARRATTLDEAVAGYVSMMNLDEGVSRDRVRTRVIDFLRNS